MPVTHEGYSELPAYGARVARNSPIMIEQITPENRSDIVFRAVGPFNVPLYFRADGIIIFDFRRSPPFCGGEIPGHEISDEGSRPKAIDELIRAREDIRTLRYTYINACRACLLSEFPYGPDVDQPTNADYYIDARELPNGWRLRDNGQCDLTRIPTAPPISAEVLSAGLAGFHSVRKQRQSLAYDILDLFYRVGYHNNHHEHQTALVLAWTIIERCQNLLWDDFINGGYKSISPYAKITGKRRKILLEDRNYTAAIKTQVLALGNVYFDQEVEWLDIARKARNDFMHSLRNVDFSDASTAHTAATRLIKKTIGVELRLFGSPGGFEYLY